MGPPHLRPPGTWGGTKPGLTPFTPLGVREDCLRDPALATAADHLSSDFLPLSLNNGAHGTSWRKTVWRKWGILME